MLYTSITKKIPLGAKHGGKRAIEFEVPEPQTVEELINFYGSESEFIARNQKFIARAAIQNAYVKLTSTAGDTEPGAELEALISKAQESVKSYRPETTTGVTQAALVSNAKSLLADETAFLSMTPEQILAKLRGE